MGIDLFFRLELHYQLAILQHFVFIASEIDLVLDEGRFVYDLPNSGLYSSIDFSFFSHRRHP